MDAQNVDLKSSVVNNDVAVALCGILKFWLIVHILLDWLQWIQITCVQGCGDWLLINVWEHLEAFPLLANQSATTPFCEVLREARRKNTQSSLVLSFTRTSALFRPGCNFFAALVLDIAFIMQPSSVTIKSQPSTIPPASGPSFCVKSFEYFSSLAPGFLMLAVLTEHRDIQAALYLKY